jgi:LmbE family N-acetylglucosaminyl deacetylase
MMQAAVDEGYAEGMPELSDLETNGEPFGSAGDEITTRVDVTGFLDQKRQSMEAHASQVQDTGPLLGLPPDAFAFALGTEWYIRRGAPAGYHDDDVFAPLNPG